MEQHPIKADPAEALRPFVELAMDPDYQARRVAEEEKRKAEEAARRAQQKARKEARK